MCTIQRMEYRCFTNVLLAPQLWETWRWRRRRGRGRKEMWRRLGRRRETWRVRGRWWGTGQEKREEEEADMEE